MLSKGNERRILSMENIDKTDKEQYFKTLVYTCAKFSSRANGATGGYGVYIESPSSPTEIKKIQFFQGFKRSSYHRAGLFAALSALQIIKQYNFPLPVIIYSHNTYVTDPFSKKWAKKWAKKGFKHKGELRPNASIFKNLLETIGDQEIRFQWVHESSPKYGFQMASTLAETAIEGKLVDEPILKF